MTDGILNKWLSDQMNLTEIWKIIEEVQDTWKGKLRGMGQRDGTGKECEGTQDIDKMDKIFRLLIYTKFLCLNTKLEKLS